MCIIIYEFCLNNHPKKTSILDLFVGPQIGHTIGSNIITHNNIKQLNYALEYERKQSNCLLLITYLT